MNRFIFTFLMAFLLLGNLAAKEVVSVSQINENKVLDTAIDLHITGEIPFGQNITVTLSSEDAWLFFDNVKPSVVVEKYAAQIKIGNEILELGVNARVNIYQHGAVVIPHPSGFTPLKVYTGKNYTGNSKEYEILTYHTELGDFDNAIQSFTLKRGYMATLANNPDGTGYSRVFIADQEDVNMAELPELMLDKVSFIRVFPWQWPSKKGWCQRDGTTSTILDACDLMGATWYYDWDANGREGSYLDAEYVPIRHNRAWPSWSLINSREHSTHVLGFNEPDNYIEADMSVEEALSQWPEMMKSGLRIGSPAPTDGGVGYIKEFIRRCDELNYRVDFVAVHYYRGGQSAQNFFNFVKDIHDATGRPIWITEWNNGANWTTETTWPDPGKNLPYTEANGQKQLNDLREILKAYDDADFVERYSIYNWVEDKRAMILEEKINDEVIMTVTPAGKYYSDNKPALAYNPEKEYIPTYKKPTNTHLSFTHNQGAKSTSLTWWDLNNELSAGYQLERSIDNKEYEVLLTGNKVIGEPYIDTNNIELNNTFSYRVKTNSYNGEEAYSNEVKFQTGKSIKLSEFQYGLTKMESTDNGYFYWNTPYDENNKPIVFLGPASYVNRNIGIAGGMVKERTETTFRFSLVPWSNENTSSLRAETIPYLGVTKGRSAIGTLDYEVDTKNAVRDDWTNVTFTRPFETTPVVFVTNYEFSNNFPIIVRVKDVTPQGFKVRLTAEQGKVIIREPIAYLAIVPGTTKIGEVSLAVGLTEDNLVGGMDGLPTISFGASYPNPVCYAGLQTSNDEITSSLRYMNLKEGEVKIFKTPPTASGTTKMNKDQLGWMVIGNADPTGIDTEKVKDSKSWVYPTVTTGKLFVDVEEGAGIVIYNLLGQKMLEKVADGTSIDVSSLTPGNYIIHTTNKKSTLFIKR